VSDRSETPRRPHGWVAPGPRPAGDGGDPELIPRADEDLSYLAGDWRLFQPKSGHRWSLDDLVTAYVAVEAVQGEREFAAIDLGCGLGSVLLLVAWSFPTITVTGIEAQPARASRARRSLRYNGVSDRCVVLDGDLRDTAELCRGLGKNARLVTGTPPYFDAKSTKLSHDAEAAACRVELRGGLETYLETGATVMAPDGDLVLCYPAASAERAGKAARERQLTLLSRVFVVPAVGKPPLIVVDRFGRSERRSGKPANETELIVRDASGQWTRAFRNVRDRFGLPARPLV
jgi:tRNA1Val (adenine37-N6)-methyltransferase